MGRERGNRSDREGGRGADRDEHVRQRYPGKGAAHDDDRDDAPDDQPPVAAPGPALRAEPWEADASTMAAFGLADAGEHHEPVQRQASREKPRVERPLAVHPHTLKFEAEIHGSTTSRTATLTNRSDQPVVLGGVIQEPQAVDDVVRPLGDFAIAGVASGTPVPPGGTAPPLVVTFQPQAHFDGDSANNTKRKVKVSVVDDQQREVAKLSLRGRATATSAETHARFAHAAVKETVDAGGTATTPRTYLEMLTHLEVAADFLRADSYPDAIPLLRTVDDQLERRCNADTIAAAAVALRAIGRSVSQATSDVSAAKIGVFDLLGRALVGATIAVDHDLDAFRSAREVLEVLLPEPTKAPEHTHDGFTQTVVVDPGSLPQVPNLDLPTTSPFDSEVEIDDRDAGKKRTMSRNGLLASPSFVDNATSISPRGSNWLTLEVQWYELTLPNGHTARLSFGDVDIGKGRPRSDHFRETGGVIYPVTDDGAFAFDTTNTPQIIAAARAIDDLILRAKNDRVLYSWAVLGFQIALAELGTAVNAEGREAPRTGNRLPEKELPVEGSEAVEPANAAESGVASTERFTESEQVVIDRAQGVLDSPQFAKLREAHATRTSATAEINGITVQYEPGLPASGMTMFGERGFLLGPEAFSSTSELSKTILHELYRLEMSTSAGGVSAELAAMETEAAFNFAENAWKELR